MNYIAIDNMTDETECYICCENYNLITGNCKCKHLYYHKDCLYKWVRNKKSIICEICNETYKKKLLKQLVELEKETDGFETINLDNEVRIDLGFSITRTVEDENNDNIDYKKFKILGFILFILLICVFCVACLSYFIRFF